MQINRVVDYKGFKKFGREEAGREIYQLLLLF